MKEILIKLPDDIVDAIKKGGLIVAGMREGKTLLAIMCEAVKNGTVLPQGHGRLIDADDLLEYIDSMPSELNVCAYRMIRRIKLTDYIQGSAPTIVKADKEGVDND